MTTPAKIRKPVPSGVVVVFEDEEFAYVVPSEPPMDPRSYEEPDED